MELYDGPIGAPGGVYARVSLCVSLLVHRQLLSELYELRIEVKVNTQEG